MIPASAPPGSSHAGSVATLADAQQCLLATAGMLPRHQPHPRSELTAILEFSFKPWREVMSHVSAVVAKVVKDSGEAANKFIRDEAHKNSVIDETKDAVSDVGNSVKQAVLGK